MIAFSVLGIPVPQGSKKVMLNYRTGKPIMLDVSNRLKPWRQEVAWMAQEAMQKAGAEMVDSGPVILECDFYFQRPKSNRKTNPYKDTKPDYDKLVRSIGDALTGICYRDDAQIAVATITKRYRKNPGVDIRVFIAEDSEPF